MPTRHPERWMWAEACEMLDRAERLHRQFFQIGGGSGSAAAWEPPTDIFETESELWILAALPGVPPADVSIMVEAGTLVIAGERRLPSLLSGARIHRMEIPQGRFERRIVLPPRRFELVRRDLIDGCLILTLKRSA